VSGRIGVTAVLIVALIEVMGEAVAAAPRIALEPILAGLAQPVYVTHPRDGSGRLFVVEQGGLVKVLAPGAGAPTAFLDLTGRVLPGGERGLLGLAFHPRFAENRRFFVNYTRRPDGATVVAEYRASTADPDRADTSEVPLLVIPQPFANHNGGMIEFGPDGFLYLGMGDGGSAFDPLRRAQDPFSLLGKMVRIDVDPPPGAASAYVSPPDNPFAGSQAGLPEIYALGLRNPWRFSFDRATGALLVGDVGQGEREEISLVTRGGNYGWPILEGTECTAIAPERCGDPRFVPPLTEYAHAGGRCAVTGGYAYRGSAGTLPAGAYVYGDFCTGEIFLLEEGVPGLLLASGLSISSFGEDQDGEIYMVGLGGTVSRLTNPDAPRVVLGVNRTALGTGDTFRVRVSVRTDAADVRADAYFGIVRPDGRTVVFLTGVTPPAGSRQDLADDARTFPRLFADLVIPAGTDVAMDDFFVYELTGADEAGTYTVIAALARPGALADGSVDPGDLLALAVASVTVSR
jgi:glucose/arabinose dehydrogenase